MNKVVAIAAAILILAAPVALAQTNPLSNQPAKPGQVDPIANLVMEGLRSLPIRCIAAFVEGGEAAYKECRKPSLIREIILTSNVRTNGEPICSIDDWADMKSNTRNYPCGIDKPLAWEISLLKALFTATRVPQ